MARCRQALIISVLVICSISSAASVASRGRSTVDDNVIESFRVASDGDELLIPVRVGGREHLFLLDTGAKVNAFDVSLAQFLVPAPAVGRKPNGTRVTLYHSPTASVGRARLPVTGYAFLRDLKEQRVFTGYDVRGVLGMEFLAHHVVEIDVDSGRVSFLKSAAGAPGKRMSLGQDALHRPTLPCTLAGAARRPFLVDSGASGILDGSLSPATIDDLLQSRGATLAPTTDGALREDGMHEGLRQLTVTHISVGEFRHANVKFLESPSCDALGLGYLLRFKVTLDFPSMCAYLAPGRRFAEEFLPFNTTGIVGEVRRPSPLAGGYCLIHEASGPARAAGLRPGDRILAINGTDVRTMTRYQLGMTLAAFPDPLRLTIAGAPGAAPREVIIRRPPPTPL